MQDYPKEKIEVIIVDGGSRDKTLEIVRKSSVDKILHNPLRTGEAGKSIGVEASSNEIILFQDSDNVLGERDWLSRMVRPFRDKGIVGAEPLYYTYRARDPLITRYCSLLGMNDPICLYLGNYDRYSYVTGKWTGLPVKTSNHDGYILLELNTINVPTIGANGFLVRAEAMKSLKYKPYLFDIDAVHQLVENGFNRVAKVRIGIVHLFANDVTTFTRKTHRRVRDYLFYEKRGARDYPWRSRNAALLKFVFCTILVFPIVKDAMRGYRKLPEVAWLFHPIASWITLITYGLEYLAPKS
jgi:glycosyltransferase involved in cell wall biosynthesis